MRIEEDFLGRVGVPEKAYYGSFTARAAENFRLSREKVHPELTRSVALIKKCAALANMELGMLDKDKGGAIAAAAQEVMDGKLDSEFILDAFQAGAGTPLHMNVNEVIANRAEELLGGRKGQYRLVHPNNHVNMSQSSNNVVPTAIKIACLRLCAGTVKEAAALAKALRARGREYGGTLKIGRTHLQDAVPMTYGQTFDAYARAIEKDSDALRHSMEGLKEAGVGGTAVGSGITAHPEFRERIIKLLNAEGAPVRLPEDGFEMTQDMNDLLSLSGSLRRYALTLGRIADDLRLLASGPKGGIAEVRLPEVEPGSSIMPGKVNPSVPEAVDMACFQARGNDHAVELAAASGQLELNFATPLIARCLFQSAELLSASSAMFRKCIEGLKVDEERTRENFERSFGYATALNPYLGYKEVSLLVKEAYRKGVSLKELILEKRLMEKEDLEKVMATAIGPSAVEKGILRKMKR
jgi:aspartate ammonia-lyase